MAEKTWSWVSSYSTVIINLGVELILLAGLIYALVRSRKKTLYAYSNAGLLGGIFFTVFTFGTTIQLLIVCPPDEDFLYNAMAQYSSISQSFIIFTLPAWSLFFLAISLSDIQLMHFEGRSPRNMIGAFLWLIFTVITIAVRFVWDYVFSVYLKKILPLGTEWQIIIDTSVPFFFAGILCYVECIMWGSMIYFFKAARHKPCYGKDYMIILGCSIREDGTPRPLLRSRIDKALDFGIEQYENTGKKLIYVPSGGKGTDECISEAEAIKKYLISKGVPEERILTDEKSVNTLENMKFSKDVIEKNSSSANIAFATTNYHVFRSGIYARDAGINAEGIGSPTKRYFWANAVLREFIALLSSRKKDHLAVCILILIGSLMVGVAEMYVRLHG